MKRGQSQFMSIGVIFSIIMIIALFAISIYVITKFVGIGKCADIALFKKDFQEKIDRAWSSEIVNDNFVGKLPNGVESICFNGENGRGREYNRLKLYLRNDANVFFYPPDNSCNNPWTKIDHIKNEKWNCFPVENGKVTIGILKGSFDSLVNIVDVNPSSSLGDNSASNSGDSYDEIFNALDESDGLNGELGTDEDFDYNVE